MIGWLQRLANAILGRVPGKVGRFDTATRMMRDADFAASVVRSAERDRRPYAEPEIDPLEELQHALSGDESDFRRSAFTSSSRRRRSSHPFFSKEASSPLIFMRQFKPPRM